MAKWLAVNNLSDEFGLHIVMLNYMIWKENPTFKTASQKLPAKWLVCQLNRPGQTLQADASTGKYQLIIIEVFSMTVSISATFSKEKIPGNLQSISNFLIQKSSKQ